MTITKYSELQQKINLHKDPDIIHIKNIKKKQRNVAQIDLPCELLLSFWRNHPPTDCIVISFILYRVFFFF